MATQGYLEKIRVLLFRSPTYELPISSSDATVPLKSNLPPSHATRIVSRVIEIASHATGIASRAMVKKSVSVVA